MCSLISLTRDGRRTAAVGSLELHSQTTKGQTAVPRFLCNDPLFIFHEISLLKTQTALELSQLNYLDLTGSWAFGLLLCVFSVLSWFLDEGKGFVHDWCVVHRGGWRAAGAECWTLA